MTPGPATPDKRRNKTGEDLTDNVSADRVGKQKYTYLPFIITDLSLINVPPIEREHSPLIL